MTQRVLPINGFKTVLVQSICNINLPRLIKLTITWHEWNFSTLSLPHPITMIYSLCFNCPHYGSVVAAAPHEPLSIIITLTSNLCPHTKTWQNVSHEPTAITILCLRCWLVYSGVRKQAGRTLVCHNLVGKLIMLPTAIPNYVPVLAPLLSLSLQMHCVGDVVLAPQPPAAFNYVESSF